MAQLGTNPPNPSPPGERLESWKEIAAYLKRSVRSVQQWEKKEGLPVHRRVHDKLGTVYAYRAELDAWWRNGHERLATQEQEEPPEQAAARPQRLRWALAAAAGALAVAAGFAALRFRENSPSSSEAVIRRIWQAGPEAGLMGTVSGDGRYVSYVDWATGDLAVRDLRTGKNRRLTGKTSWVPGDFAETSAISRDGKRIAYAWFNERAAEYELRVIGLDGSQPRVLYKRDKLWVQVFDWSPDGRNILAHFSHKDGKQELALVDASNGATRVLKTWEWGRTPRRMAFAPDGRSIVFDLPSAADPNDYNVFLLSADGRREAPLVDNPGFDQVVGWSPDGRQVVFLSDRAGTLGLWKVEPSEGAAARAPALLKLDSGPSWPLGITRNGHYYYAVGTGMTDVYTARLEPTSGKLLGEPTRISKRFVGGNSAPSWSPDGKYLAYVSQRGPAGSPNTLVIRTVATGDERDLPTAVRNLLWPPFSSPVWSPDSRFLLIAGVGRNPPQGLYQINVETGEAIAVVQSRLRRRAFHPLWLPDGRAIVFVRDGWGQAHHIVHLDLQTGKERELLESARMLGPLALSPDGWQLAFLMGGRRIMVLTVAGGEPRELNQATNENDHGEPRFSFLEWTPDGKYLLFCRNRGELWRVLSDGGKPEKLALTMPDLRYLRIHPDGQTLAFTSGDPRSELWVMESLLAAAQPVN